MRYYVTTDPHAHYTPLTTALSEAGYFADDGDKRLIVCGDMLDRGREPLQTVELLLLEKEAGHLILITGNHEDMVENALEQITDGGAMDIASGLSRHFINGTWQTLLTLAEMDAADAVRYPKRLVNKVRLTRFYRELLPFGIDYFETEHHIFTHGWIPTTAVGCKPFVRYSYDPDWRHAPREAWEKARWLNGMDMACKYGVREAGKCIVCGHRSTSYGHAAFGDADAEKGEGADYSPFRAEGILALDAGTVSSGLVHCVVIEDEPV